MLLYKTSVTIINLKVSQWFELVVFTASMEIYGTAVADKLDGNQGMLNRRYCLLYHHRILMPSPSPFNLHPWPYVTCTCIFYLYPKIVTWSLNCTCLSVVPTNTSILYENHPMQVLPSALHTGLWVLHQRLVCNLRRSLLCVHSG